jgi:hypothetical protein
MYAGGTTIRSGCRLRHDPRDPLGDSPVIDRSDPRLVRADIDAVGILTDTVPKRRSPTLRTVAGSLMALGYPLAWQEDALDRPRGFVDRLRPERVCQVEDLEAWLLLAVRIGDRMASPADGLAESVSMTARRDARRRRCFRPASYDESYRLIPGSYLTLQQEMHGTAADATATMNGRRIRALRAAVVEGVTLDVAADRHGLSTRTLGRAADMLDITFVVESADGRRAHPDDMCRHVIDACAALDAESDADADALWRTLVDRRTASAVAA